MCTPNPAILVPHPCGCMPPHRDQEVVALIEEGVYDMEKFKSGGWITDLWYEDQLRQELMMRTTGGSVGWLGWRTLTVEPL